jgi:hypothetical protein
MRVTPTLCYRILSRGTSSEFAGVAVVGAPLPVGTVGDLVSDWPPSPLLAVEFFVTSPMRSAQRCLQIKRLTGQTPYKSDALQIKRIE